MQPLHPVVGMFENAREPQRVAACSFEKGKPVTPAASAKSH